MPNLILTQIRWQKRVRDKLGVDDAYLPDTMIEQPDIIRRAEKEVIKRVPEYAGLSEEGMEWIEMAVVCACAAMLCPTMKVRVPTREQGPHFTRDVEYDWDARKLELEDERDYAIAMVVASTKLPNFGVTSRKRR